MPIHDWTRVRSGKFHHFHQSWIATMASVLNTGGLPPGYFALSEQRTKEREPDLITLHLPGHSGPTNGSGGIAVAASPPKTRFRMESDSANYARRADRISVRRDDGEVVAVIEIVSPGNKDSRPALRSFVNKAVEFLHAGINFLVIDLFPPSRRDPQGIHKAIWDRIRDDDFVLPPDKPLTLASYEADAKIVAHVEPVAVGDVLPDMPIFLAPTHYVPCPLEATYQTTWNMFPALLKGPLEESLLSATTSVK